MPAMPADQPISPSPGADAPDDEVAAPPSLPVQCTVYITPDGQVHFGALFEELVPVARALAATGKP